MNWKPVQIIEFWIQLIVTFGPTILIYKIWGFEEAFFWLVGLVAIHQWHIGKLINRIREHEENA